MSVMVCLSVDWPGLVWSGLARHMSAPHSLAEDGIMEGHKRKRCEYFGWMDRPWTKISPKTSQRRWLPYAHADDLIKIASNPSTKTASPRSLFCLSTCV
ncbi:hypothetical protein F5H01DRAFT_348565 [Linnemannia elongata]|nr:hypothetical protein F5H01DRAFT_348565 [Linnemannia elongata]